MCLVRDFTWENLQFKSVTLNMSVLIILNNTSLEVFLHFLHDTQRDVLVTFLKVLLNYSTGS